MLGVEVCSKPPQPIQATASSSGNMVATLQQIDEAEQAGSVEQPAPAVDQHAPAVAKTGRLPKQGMILARLSIPHALPCHQTDDFAQLVCAEHQQTSEQ